MLNFLNFAPKTGVKVVAWFVVLAAGGHPTYSQHKPKNSPTPEVVQQEAKSHDTAEDEEEIVHPFFTHMGIPEAVGVYNLRLLGLATRADGMTKGDFGFHLETGLTKLIGLHVRNDSFLDRTRSEVMLQFLAIQSKDGMTGFSPIIEFEIPTRKGGGSRVNTLVGFSSALVHKRTAFNQVVHYNPREDSMDYSAALVLQVGKRYFPVAEILGEGARGERPIVNLLGGLKLRVSKNLILGFAVQVPVTNRKDFSSQLVFAPDIEWKRK